MYLLLGKYLQGIKKMAAFLLAVIMVLSILPLNLTGAVTKIPQSYTVVAEGDEFMFYMNYPEADFTGFDNAPGELSTVMYILNGEYASFKDFVKISSTQFDFEKIDDTTLQLSLKPNNEPWSSGNLSLPFTVRVLTKDYNIVIGMKTESVVPFIDSVDDTIIAKTINPTVSIIAGEKVIGSDAFPLDFIGIAENSANLINVLADRLVISPPEQFRWAILRDLEFSGDGPGRFNFKNDGRLGRNTVADPEASPADGYYFEGDNLIIPLEAIINNTVRAFQSSMEIRNLRLISYNGASKEGDIKIMVTVQQQFGVDADGKLLWNNRWDSTLLTVAERVEADPNLILVTVGNESYGGAGIQRRISIEYGENFNLSDKYLVVRVLSDKGENAEVIVMVINAIATAIVSYPQSGSVVDVWLTDGIPNLTGSALGVKVFTAASGK